MQGISPLEREERAAEARALLGSKIFREAMDALNKEYVDELIQSPIGGLTATQAHAKLYALQEIRSKLQSYVTDLEMAVKRENNRK